MSEERVEHTFSVESPAKLVVKNVSGSVTVNTGNDDQIHIVAVKDLSKGNPENTTITLEKKDDGTVRAITDFETHSFWRNMNPSPVHYEITAPRQTDIRVKSISGKVSVKGFEGVFRIKSVSGRVELADLHGQIEAKAVSGKLQASELHGPADLDTVSGKLEMTGSDTPSLRASSVSGSMTVETPLGDGPYTFSTVSGSLRLIVPPGTGCEVRANSVSGRLKTDMETHFAEIGKRHWHVSLNGGGPLVTMKSVSGNLYVVSDRNAEPVSPSARKQSKEDRLDVLTKLNDGQISVEDALNQLG